MTSPKAPAPFGGLLTPLRAAQAFFLSLPGHAGLLSGLPPQHEPEALCAAGPYLTHLCELSLSLYMGEGEAGDWWTDDEWWAMVQAAQQQAQRSLAAAQRQAKLQQLRGTGTGA